MKSLRERIKRVREIVKDIAKKFFGGVRRVIRVGGQVLKQTATREYKMLLGIIKKEGLAKMRELAAMANKPGSWKGRKWKTFAKTFFKDYFKKVDEKWNAEQRLPERILNRLLADLYAVFKP